MYLQIQQYGSYPHGLADLQVVGLEGESWWTLIVGWQDFYVDCSYGAPIRSITKKIKDQRHQQTLRYVTDVMKSYLTSSLCQERCLMLWRSVRRTGRRSAWPLVLMWFVLCGCWWWNHLDLQPGWHMWWSHLNQRQRPEPSADKTNRDSIILSHIHLFHTDLHYLCVKRVYPSKRCYDYVLRFEFISFFLYISLLTHFK